MFFSSKKIELNPFLSIDNKYFIKKKSFNFIPYLALCLFTSSLQGCLSSGVQSTGSLLPQASTQFDDDVLKVNIEHSCSSGTCRGFEATLENLSDEPIEILISESRLLRAQESVFLEKADAKPGLGRGILALPPRSKRKEGFVPVLPDNTRLTYTMPSAVWCSLKVSNPQCAPVAKAQSECAGFARYYHETYTKASGWISVLWTYKHAQRKAVLSSLAPQFLGQSPAVQLSSTGEAPFWWGSGGDTVFYKIQCNNDCLCKELNKKRNFFKDDGFEPINKKNEKKSDHQGSAVPRS